MWRFGNTCLPSPTTEGPLRGHDWASFLAHWASSRCFEKLVLLDFPRVEVLGLGRGLEVLAWGLRAAHCFREGLWMSWVQEGSWF